MPTDTYTSGLIEALLRWLKAMGSSVVLMSATLPAQRRDALLRAWGVANEAIPELPYPRLLLADNRGLQGATCESRPLPPIGLQAVAEDLDSLAACALERLRFGGCGALIVNTVDRAQTLYLKLKEQLGDDAITLIPVHEVAGGWSLTPDGVAFDPAQALPDALAKKLYARQLKTSRKALVKHFQAEEAPRAFAEHPLLRHLKPLRLTDGCLQIGQLTVRLDAELGLLYQKGEDQA